MTFSCGNFLWFFYTQNVKSNRGLRSCKSVSLDGHLCVAWLLNLSTGMQKNRHFNGWRLPMCQDCGLLCVLLPVCFLWPSFSLTLIVNLIPGVSRHLPQLSCVKISSLSVSVRWVYFVMFVCLQPFPVCITLDLIILNTVEFYSRLR